MQMNSIARKTAVLAPFVVACAFMINTPAVRADDQAPTHDTSPCSNKTLRGDYGLTIEGLVAVPGPGLPLRGVVLQHYDGYGHITQVDHVITNGIPPTLAWTPGTGTYTVYANCTGKAEIKSTSNPEPLKLHFVITKEGREIRQVVDGNAVVATGSKVR